MTHMPCAYLCSTLAAGEEERQGWSPRAARVCSMPAHASLAPVTTYLLWLRSPLAVRAHVGHVAAGQKDPGKPLE